MPPSIIASDTLPSGQLMCVATERTHNSVYLFDGAAWRRLVRWGGHEVTAACACGDTIVCAALDDVVYLVQGATISKVKLPKDSDWIYGAAALSGEVALLGGLGLHLISVADQTVTRKRLSEFNISKPGRGILAVVNTGSPQNSRTLLLGKKNLLVDYRGDSAVELIDSKKLPGRELFFQDAAKVGNDLWLAGTSGAHPFLARLDGDTVQFVDLPPTRQNAPSIMELNGEVIVGADGLFAGKPGQWRQILPASAVPGTIVSFCRAPDPLPICALTSDGQSFFTDGHTCQHLPVF